MKRITAVVFFLALFFFFMTACTSAGKKIPSPGEAARNSQATTQAPAPSNTSTQDVITARAKEIVAALKAKDTDALSKVVHPDKGVRLSPYSHVNTTTDRVLTAAQVKNAFSDTTKYNWGSYDGSGEPMNLTMEEYYNKFIYDVDFVNAPQISYNQPLGKGNTVNNSKEVYPKANIVEFYFPGFEAKYEGMDWRSLRLVFEQKDATWYVVGVIHDQWTI